MQRTLSFQSQDEERALFGMHDSVLKRVRRAYGVRLVARPGRLTIDGDEGRTADAERALASLLTVVRTRGHVTDADVERALRPPELPPSADGPIRKVIRDRRGKYVEPKTPGQAAYLRLIEAHDVVFAVGPAGTGKTFLAVAMAVRALKEGRFRRLVLCRPAVEAGERLGFLPGDFHAKVNPYLRPLYDSLEDLLDPNELRRLAESGVVEIVPLAYMRGRTLDDAFIILDEAQNTTPKQMKMFLTRMGCHSKAVVTGDVTQVDLPGESTSGLEHVRDVLAGVRGIAFATLTRDDVVRHRLVREIVDAYDGSDETNGPASRNAAGAAPATDDREEPRSADGPGRLDAGGNDL